MVPGRPPPDPPRGASRPTEPGHRLAVLRYAEEELARDGFGQVVLGIGRENEDARRCRSVPATSSTSTAARRPRYPRPRRSGTPVVVGARSRDLPRLCQGSRRPLARISPHVPARLGWSCLESMATSAGCPERCRRPWVLLVMVARRSGDNWLRVPELPGQPIGQHSSSRGGAGMPGGPARPFSAR